MIIEGTHACKHVYTHAHGRIEKPVHTHSVIWDRSTRKKPEVLYSMSIALPGSAWRSGLGAWAARGLETSATCDSVAGSVFVSAWAMAIALVNSCGGFYMDACTYAHTVIMLRRSVQGY